MLLLCGGEGGREGKNIECFKEKNVWMVPVVNWAAFGAVNCNLALVARLLFGHCFVGLLPPRWRVAPSSVTSLAPDSVLLRPPEWKLSIVHKTRDICRKHKRTNTNLSFIDRLD